MTTPLPPDVLHAALTAVVPVTTASGPAYDRRAFDADITRVVSLLRADVRRGGLSLADALSEAASAAATGAQCEAAVRAEAFVRTHQLTWTDVFTPRHATMLPPPSPDARAAAKWSPRTPTTPDEPLPDHDPIDDAEET